MEIRKIELNLGQKVANPFKTTRKSTTNPFYSINFEGNTIDPLICADVLDSFKGKENKLKMISSSVMGSMTRLKNSITEPIVQFVNRVKEGLSATWNNTMEKTGLKNISENLHSTGEKINNVLNTDVIDILNYDVSKGISDSISGLGKTISEKINITGIGEDLSAKWTSLIGKVHSNRISSDTPVAELKDLWLKENELIANSAKEVA